jgi:type II secretory pathway component PulF
VSDMLVCRATLLDSLEVAGQVVNHSLISAAEKKLKAAVRGGGSFSQAIEKSGIFPPVVAQMARGGEETGNLGEMFSKCAENLDRDIDIKVRKTLLMLEPSLTLLLAGVVGFIALSIYLPMFDMMRVVSN